jgi:hypothetical protein
MQKLKQLALTIYNSKRVRSFAWRLGAMIAIAVVSFTSQEVANATISPQIQVVLGLILGEITKALNNSYVNQ